MILGMGRLLKSCLISILKSSSLSKYYQDFSG